MNPLALPEVMHAVHRLPSLPAVVMELLSSLERPDAAMAELAQNFSHDQALTAKALRIANSSFYGMPRQVTSVTDAIVVMGLNNTRNLVVATAMINGCAQWRRDGFDPTLFWSHSIGTALCAQALAQQLGLGAGPCYAAGLLHDIGRLLLASQFPVHYAAVTTLRTSTDCYPVDAEREVLGLDHALIGEALARHWKLPVMIQHAIARHHDNGLPDVQPEDMVIHVADAIVHALDLAQDQDDLVPHVCENAVERLKLNEPILRLVMRTTERAFRDTCDVMLH